MVDENKQVDSVEVADSAGKHNDSRRRWLKKAGMASPALLLLANRPAMAAGCTISGFMSVNMGTSLTVHEGATCNGWSPGNWKNDRGQITSAAWNMTGLSPSTPFKTVFDTRSLGGAQIRKVIGGTPENNVVDYQSRINQTFIQELQGNTKTNSITQHAAACYLNAMFLQGGGAGSNPDPWMLNYPTADDIIGLYLMYEMSHMYPQAGVTYQLERGGLLVGRSDNMTVNDYNNFFVSISDGGGSDDWQSGL
ncbi:hypothetical protein [Bowmanella dokdonensis]|uniref:Tat pathway signal sequence domain protein n=1 Tax=Bowmanella dokdonensis TaxID=751969 RepID=A0A939IPC4_9ALTE|nr:hypothetical protein [Bowmanella dokdonensis]MBN7827293.1 hypothetical protein [Bowmanella dokdonensis]